MIFRASGFTLLEVMISVCLIGLVVTAIIEFQARGMSIARETMDLTTALMLVNEKMVQWERGTIPEGGGEGDFAPDRPDYRWKINITDVNSHGLKKVSFLVTWGERGRERDLRIERLWFQEASR